MDREFTAAMESAIASTDKGSLASGRNQMLGAYEACRDPLGRVFAAYNLGAIFWAKIGDGANARKYYQLAYDEATRRRIDRTEREMPGVVANTCENLMHLSLTYDEFFQWAERLRRLQPEDDVFRGMMPHIEDARNKGVSWAGTFESLAAMCYNRNDPRQDRKEYARAAATYHLLLLNREAMRLSREAWGRIVYEFGTVSMRVAADAASALERLRQPVDRSEFTFIVGDAKSFVDTYLAASPADANAQSLMRNIEGFLRSGASRDDPNREKAQRIATLNNQGTELLRRREFRRALPLFEEAERISREIGDKEKLQACIGNRALVAANTGDATGALELMAQKEKICREIGFHSGLAYAYASRASILLSIGRRREASAAAKEAEKLSQEHGLDQLTRQLRPLLDQLQ